MPRRVIATAYDLDSLTVEDVPEREAGEGRVVIRVAAAGVNPSDLKSIRGQFGDDPAKLPLRLGAEVAGTVTAAGPGVDAVSVGDEVIAYRVVGGWADEVVVPVENVFLRPATVTADAGAGLLLVGTTAWHLIEATRVSEGDRVIVHGASGAVGRLAVQLARLRGASVVGTASARNLEAVEALGATAVEYGPGLDERLRDALPGGAGAALDTVGTDEALDVSVALVADRRRIATINGFAHGAELGVTMLGGGPGADPGSELRRAARQPLIDLLAEGRIDVALGPAFPLDRARDALDLIATGHPGGKVVLHPGR